MNWRTTSAGSDTSPSGAANWSEAKEIGKQLRRFVVAGALSVIVDLSVYSILLGVMAWSSGVAKALSYCAGVIVGFSLNKYWTFESRRKSWSEPASYLCLYLATLVVNVLCNHFALTALRNERQLFAFIFATGVTTILNFFGMRLVTFRRGVHERRLAARLSESRTRLIRKAG